jgi:hypothetical protein
MSGEREEAAKLGDSVGAWVEAERCEGVGTKRDDILFLRTIKWAQALGLHDQDLIARRGGEILLV